MLVKNRKRFIINNIERLLKADWNLENIESCLVRQSPAELQALLEHSGQAAIESLKALRYKMSPEEFRRLCQQNFSDLFRLKDQFLQMQQGEAFAGLAAEAKAFYLKLQGLLDDVEGYLASTGIRSMAADELLPPYHLAGRLELLKQQQVLFIARCKSRAVDESLLKLLTTHFNGFVARREIQQWQLHYTEQLMEHLLHVLGRTAEGAADEAMLHGLIVMNFNTYECYQYCCRKIETMLRAFNNSKAKLLAISCKYKALMQLLPASTAAQEPGNPNLRQLLLDFVNAERSYLELAIVDERRHDLKSAKRADFKLMINGSMRELSLFIQLLMQQNVILVGKGGIKEISSFLAANVSTIGSETLSPESLAKRYREAQPACCAAVLRMLEGMILILRRDYLNKSV